MPYSSPQYNQAKLFLPTVSDMQSCIYQNRTFPSTVQKKKEILKAEGNTL